MCCKQCIQSAHRVNSQPKSVSEEWMGVLMLGQGHPNRAATIADVARAAQVSSASVSRALNGERGVSLEVADRVRGVAHRLGYSPNVSARNLRRRETRVWAL